MEKFNRKAHWETIYGTKALEEVSWYQPVPETSLQFVEELQLSPEARIIDIGGGDSLLADHLLEKGYRNLQVLDISEAAIVRAKQRLGKRAAQVKWTVSDVTEFEPAETFDLWHDRAAFHFLTAAEDISTYVQIAARAVAPGGSLVLGTFSEQGPEKCSGIRIRQYSEASLSALFEPYFQKKKCIRLDHSTPFGTVQNFIFCRFERVDIGN